MPPSSSCGRASSFQLHFQYGLLTLAYMGGIYWLSSLSDHGSSASGLFAQLDANLLHIPLFAGLAFCVLQAVSGGRGRQPASAGLHALTLFATGVYAALDEWHQSFVLGRSASAMDLLLDLVGIIGMLLILRRLGADSLPLRQGPTESAEL